MCQTPVLAFPNFEKDLILYTDASGFGIDAVLMQKDSLCKHRVLAYASRLLNKAEQNYDVTKRESLAVNWALRHFRELILGYKIHVHTDHYGVTETFKSINFTSQFARCHLTIQEFNPTILYSPGNANSMADVLSCNVATISVMTENPAMPAMDEIRKHQRLTPSVLVLLITSNLVMRQISLSCK